MNSTFENALRHNLMACLSDAALKCLESGDRDLLHPGIVRALDDEAEERRSGAVAELIRRGMPVPEPYGRGVV